MNRPNCPECSRAIAWLPGNEVSAHVAGRVEQANQDIATLRALAAEVATDARTCDPNGDALASLTYATYARVDCGGGDVTLTITIPGEPQAKERAKVFGFKSKTGKTGARGVTPPRTRAYAERVKLCALAAVSRAGWAFSDDEYYRVNVTVFRTHFGVGGDADNYAKAVLDGMNGIVFADDRYVRRLQVSIEMDATNPRVEVTVERLAVAKPKKSRKSAA